MKQTTKQAIEQFCVRYPALAFLQGELERAVEESVSRIRRGGKVLVCGNGGSAADCEHIVGELLKSFYLPRPLPPEEQQAFEAHGEEGKLLARTLQGGIPAISLVSQVGILTAFGNDADPACAYAQQVYAYGRSQDLFIGITTSGNAANVRYAAIAARQRGCLTIGLTGESGGKLREHCDILLAVPERETYKVQEYHLPVYHLYCMCVEQEIFGEAEA